MTFPMYCHHHWESF